MYSKYFEKQLRKRARDHADSKLVNEWIDKKFNVLTFEIEIF